MNGLRKEKTRRRVTARKEMQTTLMEMETKWEDNSMEAESSSSQAPWKLTLDPALLTSDPSTSAYAQTRESIASLAASIPTPPSLLHSHSGSSGLTNGAVADDPAVDSTITLLQNVDAMKLESCVSELLSRNAQAMKRLQTLQLQRYRAGVLGTGKAKETKEVGPTVGGEEWVLGELIVFWLSQPAMMNDVAFFGH